MKAFYTIVAVILTLLIILTIQISRAHGQHGDHHNPDDPAHWYDADCCSLQDCAPVEEEWTVPEGRLMRSKHGTVLITPQWIKDNPKKVRASKDNRLHVCIRDTEVYGGDYFVDPPPPKKFDDPTRFDPLCLYETFKV